MCEQPLIDYCLHRNEQLTNSTTASYLSPMNLVVVTLWYLKNYHSERYIASELNLDHPTMNYFLSAVVDILHSCVCAELISLSADMDNRRIPHGSERNHRLIVDWTCNAIPESSDLEQRKAYYYGKVQQTTH